MKINRKHIVGILVVLISSIGLVAALAWVALSPVYEKKGFTRTYIAATPVLEVLNKCPRNKEVVEICGVTKSRIFYKTKNADQIFSSGYDLQKGAMHLINAPNNTRVSSLFYTFIDSPYVNILAGNIPISIQATFRTYDVGVTKYPTGLFSRAVQIGPKSFVTRGFSSTEEKDQVFMKSNVETKVTKVENNISKTNHDAGISEDGYLHYDSTTNTLVYVYFFENQYMCMDTNLNLVYKAPTIDPAAQNKLSTGLVNDKTYTNLGPNRAINDENCVYNGYLYNVSKVKADNEVDFEHNTVVDIYDLAHRKYIGSFYIPHFKNEKMTDFKVVRNMLVALYKTEIISYKLNTEFK